MEPNPTVHIWTDGSCHPNPGCGGWAAVIVHDEAVFEISGRAMNTTSNMMELRAIHEGIWACQTPATIIVYTDSELCLNWLTGRWKRKVPRIRSTCEAIENLIDKRGHNATIEKVPTRRGGKHNERAHYLAGVAREGGGIDSTNRIGCAK